MQTASAIQAAGGESLVVAGDVTAEDFPARIVKGATEAFGAIDILINNAGKLSVMRILLDLFSTQVCDIFSYTSNLGKPLRNSEAVPSPTLFACAVQKMNTPLLVTS